MKPCSTPVVRQTVQGVTWALCTFLTSHRSGQCPFHRSIVDIEHDLYRV